MKVIWTCLKGALLGLLLMGPALRAAAMPPPSPEEVAAYQADGSWEKRVAFAKSLGHHQPDQALVEMATYKVRRMLLEKQGLTPAQIDMQLAPPTGWQGVPTTGTVKVLVLLVDFTDYPAPANAPVADIQEKVFGNGVAAPPYDSLKSYYERASYGKLHITGKVLGWYHHNGARSTIPMTSKGREDFIKQVLTYYKGLGEDFTQYDNNGDGKIDFFSVVWTGPDNGWSNFWWAYQTGFGDQTFTVDGKKVGKYVWQYLSRPQGGAFSPRTLIHETGHALGLPDYYDYDDKVGPKGGLGGLDMMHGNWGDHNGFSKWVLDWLEPKVYTGPASVSLRAAGTYPDAAIFAPGASLTKPFSEFFLVQNRQKVGNDVDHPGSGLLVYHVDARLNAWGNNYLYDNSYTDHKLIRMMEADGLEEIEAGRSANAGDYWTQGKVFNTQSTPNSTFYSGLGSWMGIKGISASGDTMTFEVFGDAVDTTAPTGLPTSPVDEGELTTSPNLTFTWGRGTVQDLDSPITAYQLQVGTSRGAFDLYDGLVFGPLAASLPVGRDGFSHFARVRAMNAAGLYSGWSDSSDGIVMDLPALTCQTLDNCGLIFKTSPDLPWTSQTSVKVAGDSAAVSPALADNQAAFVQTTLQGPGTLSFQWKVSSESNYDFLTLSLDGQAQGKISGEVDWAAKTLAIPAGLHVIRWTYEKDGGDAGGQDKAWLDQVAFTATGGAVLHGFSPASGPVGTLLTLTGSGLTGATQVSFGGVKAVPTVISDTQLQVKVPGGATTGLLGVTLPGATLTTLTPFVSTTSYDANLDGVIDLNDLARFAKAFGSKVGDKSYDPAADLNGDGVVDEQDVTLFFNHL